MKRMAGALINSRGTIIFIDPLISYGANNEICETGNCLLLPLPVTAETVPKDSARLAETSGAKFLKPDPGEVIKLPIE